MDMEEITESQDVKSEEVQPERDINKWVKLHFYLEQEEANVEILKHNLWELAKKMETTQSLINRNRDLAKALNAACKVVEASYTNIRKHLEIEANNDENNGENEDESGKVDENTINLDVTD